MGELSLLGFVKVSLCGCWRFASELMSVDGDEKLRGGVKAMAEVEIKILLCVCVYVYV